MDYEKIDPITGEHFTWIEGESLQELSRPERIAQIKEQHAIKQAKLKQDRSNLGLEAIFEAEDENGETPCLMCHL